MENSKQGVQFTRNTATTGPDVRFRENALRIGDYGVVNDQRVIRTDNALKAKFGPSGTKGRNAIVAEGKDLYVIENDQNPSNTLNAARNLWERDGASHELPDSLRLYITSEVADSARVDVSVPEEPGIPMCAPSPAAAQRPGLSLETAMDPGEEPRGGNPLAASPVLPDRTGLSVPSPTPSREAVEVRFGLAGTEARSVQVEIFDVRGRRVRTLMTASLAGGWYGVSWSGDDDASRRVSAGVYFVRLTAGEYREVRKVVMLQ